MKYKLIVDDHSVSFAKIINEHLEDGWELYFGTLLSSYGQHGHKYLAQAMIKKDNKT